MGDALRRLGPVDSGIQGGGWSVEHTRGFSARGNQGALAPGQEQPRDLQLTNQKQSLLGARPPPRSSGFRSTQAATRAALSGL